MKRFAGENEVTVARRSKGTRLEDTSISLPLATDVNVELFLNLSEPRFLHLESAGVGLDHCFPDFSYLCVRFTVLPYLYRVLLFTYF